MDTLKAFAMGEANRDKPVMVFDWHKAARLIKAKKPSHVEAGLKGDWEWTGGSIWQNDEPYKDDYTYLASTWATPQIKIDGEIQECYVMQSETDEWDEDTRWPESALDILGEAA